MPDAPNAPDPADPELLTTLHVREAVAGTRASVAWLVGRFTPLLRAQAAMRLSGPLRSVIDADDLVQDVWIRVLPRLADLRPRGGRLTPVLVRFLATTLLHRLNTLMERRLVSEVRDARADDALAAAPADVTQALSTMLRAERKDAVLSAIEALDETDRAIVVMRGIEQNPVTEIALLLGLKPNTVTVRYRRALERLRERLPGSIVDELPEEADDAT